MKLRQGKKNLWSAIETELLVSTYELLGSHWNDYTGLFPGRTANQIKSKFHNMVIKIEDTDGASPILLKYKNRKERNHGGLRLRPKKPGPSQLQIDSPSEMQIDSDQEQFLLALLLKDEDEY